MKKNGIAIIVALIMTLSLILIGCDTKTDAQTTPDAGTAASENSTKVVEEEKEKEEEGKVYTSSINQDTHIFTSENDFAKLSVKVPEQYTNIFSDGFKNGADYYSCNIIINNEDKEGIEIFRASISTNSWYDYESQKRRNPESFEVNGEPVAESELPKDESQWHAANVVKFGDPMYMRDIRTEINMEISGRTWYGIEGDISDTMYPEMTRYYASDFDDPTSESGYTTIVFWFTDLASESETGLTDEQIQETLESFEYTIK